MRLGDSGHASGHGKPHPLPFGQATDPVTSPAARVGSHWFPPTSAGAVPGAAGLMNEHASLWERSDPRYED